MLADRVTAVNKQFPYWANRPLFWLVWSMVLVYIPTHLWNIFVTPKDGSFSSKLLEWGAMQGDAVFHHGQVWRLLTSAFLHANFVHILFNMLALVMFTVWARQYERSKYAWLWMFFIGAIVGNVIIGFMAPQEGAVGASGGIMALWGGHFAMIVRAYFSKNQELAHVRHTLKLKSEIFNLALQVVLLDHLIPNIGWQCHLGGLITGFAIGMLITLRGQLYVWASRPGIAALSTRGQLVIRKVKGRSIKDVEREVDVVKEEFDTTSDFIVTSCTFVDWRNRVHQRLVRVLAGSLHGQRPNWDGLAFLGRVPTVAEVEYDKRHKVGGVLPPPQEPEVEPHNTLPEDPSVGS